MSWLRSFWQPLSTPEPETTFSNFTPRAQQVLALARKEADRLNHNFVGTEHVLLGLIKLGQGTAVAVLNNMGLDLDTVRLEVEKQVGVGSEAKVPGNVPYTPRVKKALAFAAKEARALNHSYVGTEHILLGLLREGDGVSARVLKSLDIDVESTRQSILRELDPNRSPPPEKITMSQKPKTFPREPVDIARRYDVHCWEGDHEIVYRNVLFKGVKTLLKDRDFDPYADYVELEQADGQPLFISRPAIKHFSEHRPTQSPAS